MKKRSLMVVITSVFVLAVASFLISGYMERKAANTTYYWFYTDTQPYPYLHTFTGRCNTAADEKKLMERKNKQYPEIKQEYGWAVSGVTVNPGKAPIPKCSSPDKILSLQQ